MKFMKYKFSFIFSFEKNSVSLANSPEVNWPPIKMSDYGVNSFYEFKRTTEENISVRLQICSS